MDAVELTPGPAWVARLYAEDYVRLVRVAVLLSGSASDAEDLVQEAFARAYRSSRSPAGDDEARAFVHRILVNLCHSRWRRLQVERRFAQRRRPSATVDDAARDVERTDIVRALKRIGRRQREAVVFRFFMDLSERQTAEVMGISVGAVKAYTSRGLREVRNELESVEESG